jgi:hypothetical protein
MRDSESMRDFSYRQPRMSTGFEVDFVVDGKTIRGLCRDASHAGIRAEFEGSVIVGSSGLLILRHPIGVLKLDAHVAYNEDYQVGLIFHFETVWEQRMTVEFIASITNPTSKPRIV